MADDKSVEDYLKKIFLERVDQVPGVKGITLITEVMSVFYKAGMDAKGPVPDVVEILNNLVETGDLVEVEYVLSPMSYRVKSVYFPKGTEVKLVT